MSLLLAFQGAAPPPEAETFATLFTRAKFAPYRRVPALGWNPDTTVAVVAVVEDGGSSLFVVPTLDGYRLARAARFYYWGRDNSAAVAAPEESTLSPTLVRIPFRGLGRSPYLWHRDYDSAPVAPEESTLAPFLVRLPFKGLGRSAYLWHEAQDRNEADSAEILSPLLVRIPFKGLGRNPYLWHGDPEAAAVAPEESTLAPFLVRLPFKVYGRNPYLFRTAQDLDAPAGFVDPTFEPFLVRIPLRGLGRNPYLYHTARDLDAVADIGDGGSTLWVVPNWDGYRLARATRFLYWTPVQGDDAPIVVAGNLIYIPTFRPRRR
jgi:hypothetical protein